jgi:hypothetical protein
MARKIGAISGANALPQRVGDVEDAQILGRFLASLGQYSGS